MGGDLLLLFVGFLLTSVLGGLLGYLFQGRSWAHQHEVQRRDQERQQALRTFEEVSRLLDRRLYRMRRLYWAARSRALGTGDAAELAAAQAGYREVLFEWNDNLNRTLALVHTYFGGEVRKSAETFATTVPPSRISSMPSPVTSPITTALRFHLRKSAMRSSSRPRSATSSIRSWDSDIITS